ncbi:MAG: hypothetical protein ACSLFP_00195 [Acidimicrobiales bacterium]
MRLAVVLFVAVALPSALVALVAVNSPEFSVLDEPVHSDYLRRVEQGEVPRMGDKVLEATVRDVQCRTVQGRTNAPCDLPRHEPEMLGADGYQYQAQHPPVYYAVTAVLRQVVRLGPADDFVTTARLTGMAWLSAGLLLFWAAARRLGCRFWPTALLTTLLALSPGVLYQSATINNDAAAILTGSAALFMFAHLRNAPSALAAVGWTAVAVTLVLIKPTGVISIAAACAALLIDAMADRRLTWRRAGPFVLPLIGGLIAYAGWSVVREARGYVDYDIVLEALLSFKMTDDFPLDDVVANVTRLIMAYPSGGLPIAPPFVTGPALLIMFPLVAAALMPLVATRGGDAAQRVGSLGLLALVTGGPAFTLLFYLDYSIEGGPSSRYGLSLLPLLAVAGAATFKTRRAMVVLSVLGLLLLGALMIATLYPTTRV